MRKIFLLGMLGVFSLSANKGFTQQTETVKAAETLDAPKTSENSGALSAPSDKKSTEKTIQSKSKGEQGRYFGGTIGVGLRWTH